LILPHSLLGRPSLSIRSSLGSWPPSFLLLNKTLVSRSQIYCTADGWSVSMSCCRAHSETCDQILLPVRRFGRCLATAVVLLSCCHCQAAGVYFTIRTVFLNFTSNCLINFDIVILINGRHLFGNFIKFLCNLYINKIMICST
jgi:hypothetical protein